MFIKSTPLILVLGAIFFACTSYAAYNDKVIFDEAPSEILIEELKNPPEGLTELGVIEGWDGFVDQIDLRALNQEASNSRRGGNRVRKFIPCRQTGLASWYGPRFHGKLTANGTIFNTNELTAAHPTLPIKKGQETWARVVNKQNGLAVIVRLTDRGPFEPGRIIDLSKKAKEAIGMDGIAPVLLICIPPPYK